jgi:hypothetical protein
MVIGQVVLINDTEYILICDKHYHLEFIDIDTGEILSIGRDNFKAYKNKQITDKTYRDLIECPLWVKAKILGALNIKFTLELL